MGVVYTNVCCVIYIFDCVIFSGGWFVDSVCIITIWKNNFRDVDIWDVYYYRFKERIESQLGNQLTWRRLKTKGDAALVRHIQLSESREWNHVFEILISDLLKLKRVFADFYFSVLEDENLDYEEIENPGVVFEGAKKTIIVNRYERDPKARRQCIEAHGCRCSICELDFGEIYGEVGNGFIHVHHIVPLSTIGENYEVNPKKDLIPVCPNCHAVLHRNENGVFLTVNELKQRIRNKLVSKKL